MTTPSHSLGLSLIHISIRPSNVELTPELVRKSLTQEQYRLYKLIWSRFLSCQMANAVYDLSLIHIWFPASYQREYAV